MSQPGPERCPAPQMALEEQQDLLRMQEQLMSLVVSTMAEGEEFSASFEEHSHLWKESPEEFLQRFLTLDTATEEGEAEPKGEAKGEPKGEAKGETKGEAKGEPEKPLAPGIPPLSLFQQEVWDRCLEMCWVLGCPGGRWVPREVPGTACDPLSSPD